jgi:hypothetical protein
MHGNANKKMNDLFHIQGIAFIFQMVNSKGHLSIKLTPIGFKWAWLTCYIKSHKTSIEIWDKYVHLTFPHFPCLTTLRCESFQAFQKYL